MSTIFSDNFDRADNDDLGTNWDSTGDAASDPRDVDIVSNKARFVTIDTNQATRVTTSGAHAAIADVKVTVTHAVDFPSVGVVARQLGTANQWGATGTLYFCRIESGVIETYRRVNDSDVQIISTSNTRAAGGIIALEVRGTGATVTVKQFYNGVQKGSDYSDTDASRITTAGRTGMIAMSGQDHGEGLGDLDDFLVEDFVMGFPTPYYQQQMSA